jgi:hypothetical protein
VPGKLWRDVERVSKEAGAIEWRRPGGQLMSRPTGRHWITRHVRCGLCDGPMRLDVDERSGKRLVYLRCSRTKGHTRRLSVERATKAIVEKFSAALIPAAVIAKVEEWTKLRREAKALGKEDRGQLERERDDLDRQIRRLVSHSAKIDAPDEFKAEIEGRKTMKRAVEDKLRGSDVLKTFDLQEFKDAIEAVAQDWRRQLKRDPEVIGQVLAKLLPLKMKFSPPAGDVGEWSYDAGLDYLPVLREADEDKARAMEALMRELEIEPTKPIKKGYKVIKTPPPRSGRE